MTTDTQSSIPSHSYKYRYHPLPQRSRASEHKVLRLQDLSQDQRVVFAAIEQWIREGTGVLRFGGYAGTGKSTLVSLLAHNYPHKRIAFCALTGKAAEVLRQKIFLVSGSSHFVGTIHSLIYFPVVDEKTGEIVRWGRRDVEDFNYDFIVVDEASMVDEYVFQDLQKFGKPILAVGDHGQLPPVMGKFNLMDNPQLRLDRIHRQAEGSPILKLASFVRENGDLPLRLIDEGPIRYVESRRLEGLLAKTFEERAALLNANNKLGGEYASIETPVVLCYTNYKRQAINMTVRHVCYPRQPVDMPIVGEHLVCLRNSEGTLFNGMRGEVLSSGNITLSTIDVRILFPEDEIEFEGPVCRAQLGRDLTFKSWQEYTEETDIKVKSWAELGMLFDYGYCLTVHKAQGSGFKHVVVVYERPQAVPQDDFRRWLYTALTRSSERLTIVAD